MSREPSPADTGLAAASLAVALAILLLPTAGWPAELRNSIRIGAYQTDNLFRQPVDEVEETIAVIDLTLNLVHESRALRSALTGATGFRHYVDDSADDEVVGNVFGSVEFDFVPEVLTWVAEDRYGTLQRNPYQADSPLNRENVNNFSTGPDVRLVFGSAFAMEFAARYRLNDFEESDIDNEVVSGELSLIRALSSKRSLGLNFAYDDIEYDNAAVYRAYDRTAAFLRLTSEMSRGSVTLDLGSNRIDVDGDTADGFYGSLRFDRSLSARSTLTLAYDHRFSAAGDVFRGFQDPGQSTNGPVYDISGSAEPFTANRARFEIRHERAQLDWFFGLDLREEEHVDDIALDRRVIGTRFGAGYAFGSGWRVSAGAALQRGTLDAAARDDDDAYASLALRKRLTRTIDVELSYRYAERDSTDPLAEYVENRTMLTFGYTWQQR